MRKALIGLSLLGIVAGDLSAHAQGDGWRPMSTAPHDGTTIEIMNTYGNAPWYAVCKWSNKMLMPLTECVGTPSRCKDVGLSTVTVEPQWIEVDQPGGSVDCSDPDTCHWRPYNKAVGSP